jgi:hypothetical protein
MTRNMSVIELGRRNYAPHCCIIAGNTYKEFWAAPPTGSARVRSVNFGSKLVALVANWAGFADSAD